MPEVAAWQNRSLERCNPFLDKMKAGVLDSPTKLFNTPTFIRVVEISGIEPLTS